MIYKEHKIQFFLLAEKNLCFGVPPPHEEVAIFLKEKFADSECGENCESCEATQQFVYHYILQGNRFAELRKLRSNAAIRISLLHYRETNLQNRGNCEAMKQFVYHYIHREGLYEHYKA